MTFWRACKTTSNAIKMKHIFLKYDILYQVFLMGCNFSAVSPSYIIEVA